jgi:hypothetical protein
MRVVPKVAAGVAVAVLALGLPVTAALAADATGCSGSVESFAADGSPLDSTTVPGDRGTQSAPFVIDPDGTVAWEGQTDAVITNATWSVRIGGVPVLGGTYGNDEGTSSAEGVITMSETLAPVSWVLTTAAVIPVDGSITGTGGACEGSGYIAGTGGGTLSSPVFYAGVGFAAVGIAMAAGVAIATKAATVSGGAL